MVKKYSNNYRLDIAYATIFKNINSTEEIPIHIALNITSGDNLTKSDMDQGSYNVYGGGGNTGNTHSKFNIDYKTIGIGRVGARCGCVFEIQENSWVTDNALLIQSFDKRFSLNFLRHFLSYSDLGQYANNAMQPVISKARIKDVTLPLISIEEQNVIAEILDSIEKNEKFESTDYNLLISKISLIDHWENLNKEIQIQKQLLTQLKQSILQEAIQGKLTEDWRKRHPELVSGSHSAVNLLQRIKKEKQQLIADKKTKKEKPLPPITKEEIPFELPNGWVWCRLGDISHTITKGSSPKWQGVQYVDEGVLFVTSENVGTNEIILKKKKFVQERFNEIEPRSILNKGDILTNIVGASIGRTAIWNLDFVANINQAVCLIRFPDDYFNKQFLINILNSDFGIKLMMDNQFDTGRGNLSLGAVSNFKIPLPSKNEQKAIVEKVEALMQKCTALEKEIKQSETNAKMLMQAVLKEAFEG
ncbi:MAG: hypothetical protein GZ086_00945 [Gelidibacter sp.]|nr:hypothetical protein [Gelidibacter sp.]